MTTRRRSTPGSTQRDDRHGRRPDAEDDARHDPLPDPLHDPLREVQHDEQHGTVPAAAPLGTPPPGKSGDGRRERWAGHRTARRQELVLAAIAAINRLGPGVGMDDIAAEAGVTKPVVYRYFADKADLHLAVGQHAASELLADVLGAMKSQPEPQEMLASAVKAYLDVIERSPNLYRFVINRPLSDRPPGQDVAHDYQSLIAAGIARSMGTARRGAGLDSGGAEVWAYGLVGYVRSAGDWWLERQSMSRPDLDAYVVEMVWGGMGPLFPARPRH